MAALTRDILGFKYYRADTEGGNRQKCEQMIQVSVDIMLAIIFVCLGGAPELSVGVAVGGALAVLHLVEHEREGAGYSLLL